MKTKHVLSTAALIALAASSTLSLAATPADTLKRGEYLVRIGGCNDCHTPGYGEQAGATPVNEWLTGVPLGYQGPWGTSYAANLRLSMQGLTEEQWLLQARLPRLPPMPFWALKDMSDADLKAIYHFVRSLGASGKKVPAAVAPGGPVVTPVIVMMPVSPKPVQATAAR